jgi:hypothetical protein
MRTSASLVMRSFSISNCCAALGAGLELLLQDLDLALLHVDLLLGHFDRHHLQRLVALGMCLPIMRRAR